jgi:hypothetical protein
MGNCAGKSVEGQPAIPFDKMGLTTNDSARQRLLSLSPEEQKLFAYNEMMNRDMNSGINLQAIFFVEVPIKGAYKLDYKMTYSVFESKWTEEKLRNKQHRSRPCSF